MLTELPEKAKEVLKKENITELRPAQEKAIKAGLFKGKNLLVCTPTASGKTLIAEMAATKNILEGKGKTIYIVPLVALATEKYKDFKRKYDLEQNQIFRWNVEKYRLKQLSPN